MHMHTFVCQFGRYSFPRLLFRVAPASNMFHQVIDEVFKDLSYVFDIADDIFIVEYDVYSANYDETLK